MRVYSTLSSSSSISRTLESDGGEGAGELFDFVAERHEVGEVLGSLLQCSSAAGEWCSGVKIM